MGDTVHPHRPAMNCDVLSCLLLSSSDILFFSAPPPFFRASIAVWSELSCTVWYGLVICWHAESCEMLRFGVWTVRPPSMLWGVVFFSVRLHSVLYSPFIESPYRAYTTVQTLMFCSEPSGVVFYCLPFRCFLLRLNRCVCPVVFCVVFSSYVLITSVPLVQGWP